MYKGVLSVFSQHNSVILDYEASFIRLIDKITNGSTIEVNETGISSISNILIYFFYLFIGYLNCALFNKYRGRERGQTLVT